MSKYEPLWRHIRESGRRELTLSFEEIGRITGFPMDHSFLRYRKELTEYGYEAGHVSLKERTAAFRRLELSAGRIRLIPCSREEMEELIAGEDDEELKSAYRQMLDGALKNPADWVWYAVWRIESPEGETIGDLSFKGMGPNGAVEIGYGIREEYRRQGYAAEAVSALVRWAARQPRVRRVEAETDPDNIASQRVLKKCGFVPTGTLGEEGPRFVWAPETGEN